MLTEAPAVSEAWSPDLYARALRYAGERHGGQVVPDSQLPYVVHVCMVAAEVKAALARERFRQPDLAVQCSLLHDTLEDTATTYEDLLAEFGPEVAGGVRALTKDPALPKAERMRDSLRRIQEAPREVWIVKLADRITNLQPPPSSWDAAKRTAYCEQAKDICSALGSASAFLRARMEAKIEAYRAHIGAMP